MFFKTMYIFVTCKTTYSFINMVNVFNDFCSNELIFSSDSYSFITSDSILLQFSKNLEKKS